MSYQNSNYNYDESYEDNGHNDFHIWSLILVVCDINLLWKWESLSVTYFHKGAYETKHWCELLINSVQKVSYQNSNYNYDESYEDNGHYELHIFRKWESLSLTCSHKGAYETEHWCESLINMCWEVKGILQ